MGGGLRPLREIVEAVLQGQVKTPADLEKRKRQAASELGLSSLPSNADILAQALPEERDRLKLLVRKPTRTLSGVAVIAAMTSPARCPHGICVPCPGGIRALASSPQSYTGQEPAALRAGQHGYDPYRQVHARLRQLEEIGHPVDKAELIIMGGTITSRPLGYQQWFVKRCLQAMNDYPLTDPLPSDPSPSGQGLASHLPSRPSLSECSLSGHQPSPQPVRDPPASGPSGWQSFREAAELNQRARVRNVGMTFETRPDWCRPGHIQSMLSLGATKVELGVQSIRDEILAGIRSGHDRAATVDANRNLREAGLKVGFHMMPGLPGSSPSRDLEEFRELFQSPDFRPDYLKIYPTLVVEGTELYDLYRRGEYIPLGDEEAAELISRVKEIIPPYTRLQRVQRDIPARLIVAGVKKSNLRQLAEERLRAREGRCRCIRCREAGLQGVSPGQAKLQVESYEACGAQEHFISYLSGQDVLVGFLRLRLGEKARVRELHVYGPLIPLGRRGGWQHQGYGAGLLQAAEEMAVLAGYRSIEVTSAIGVRDYYRRLGYRIALPYVVKDLA
ncbi:MAG: tRNA uridine(34) 5-carboxymethylaminomethyl modification radical SAM/GNAT enzyme Elp3 [Methanosarcinales archaeon]|nr:tRNA uridine(34) 5-carboxymethylaminomethyl modification radical SAM/GNAT enzyme Elp3 [Methanosarcinales archaeon]